MPSFQRDHHAVCTDLKERHAILLDLIGGAQFHFADIPLHGNIGDLLIMHGTLAFFRRAGLTPKTLAPCCSFDPGRVAPHEVIVFQGGGNFGDIYAPYQNLRERTIAACPQNRIVVLPQTIHFSSTQRCAASAAIFRSHPDVHLCVRDPLSFELARQFSDNVYLLPDMAHQLWPMASPLPTSACGGTLFLHRSDDEHRGHQGCLGGFDIRTETDWPALVGTRERHIHRFRRTMDALARRGMDKFANRLFSARWVRYSQHLVGDAAALFAAHEHVVTDRLHGHILACLLDIPHVAMDNSYGKNLRYVNAWTAASELVTVRDADPESTVLRREADMKGLAPWRR